MYEMNEERYYDMEQIAPRLWLGDLTDAMHFEGLKAAGITACLNVASAGHKYSHEGIKCYHLPLIDGQGNSTKELEAAALLLGTLHTEGETVLIHCLAGMSRSPTVAALMLVTNRAYSTFDKCMEAIAQKRPIVSPHWALRKMAREILKEG